MVTAPPDLLTVLAEPTRRRILDVLLEGPRSVGDLVGALNVSQPSTSKHLRILRELGLVSARRSGSQVYYSLRSGAATAQVRAILAAVRRPGSPPA